MMWIVNHLEELDFVWWFIKVAIFMVVAAVVVYYAGAVGAILAVLFYLIVKGMSLGG